MLTSDGIPAETPDGTTVPKAANRVGRRIPASCGLAHVRAVAASDRRLPARCARRSRV